MFKKNKKHLLRKERKNQYLINKSLYKILKYQ